MSGRGGEISLSKWIVPALCVGIILTLGTPLFSMVRTSAIFNPLMSRILPGLDPMVTYRLQVLVRRAAHVTEYAMLFMGLSLWPLRGRPLAAFFVCAGVAVLDESLQALSASRSGTIFDVADDTAGATIILGLAMPYWERLRHLRLSSAKSQSHRRRD